jgi:DNA-binding CsgD family transcriptional regulator
MDSHYLEACNLAVLAAIEARRGQEAECREHAARAAAFAQELGEKLIRAETRLALGLLALAAGRLEDATAELEGARSAILEGRVGEPGVLPYGPELVEAYVRQGRRDDALEELERLERAAALTGRRWAQAAAARCRALLAADDELDASFAVALDLHDRAALPFERGRTRLAYGERLRRAGRRRDARPQLRAALEELDAVGASIWSERARAELRATGETIGPRTPSAAERLTAQELQIALLVAQGKTNREVAEALFLSPKTVEYHLAHVYRKLDIHSRRELIRLFAAEAPAGALEAIS